MGIARKRRWKFFFPTYRLHKLRNNFLMNFSCYKNDARIGYLLNARREVLIVKKMAYTKRKEKRKNFNKLVPKVLPILLQHSWLRLN